MSDSEKDPMSDLLSSFALGPAWARANSGKEEKIVRKEFSAGERPFRRDERRPDDRGRGERGRDRDGERRPFRKGGKFEDRRSGPPRNEEAPPADGVRVTLVPDAQAVHLIGKEVHQVARVYPLYDVAKILLAERARCRAVFEAAEPAAPLFRGKLDDSLFLTRDEAVRHLWQSDLKKEFIEEEVVEIDPPSGNFQAVAKCGLTGMWLGPPNFHTYQVNLRRLHRECFPTMPFAAYSAKVRTERGEEAVNAWLETMKKKTRWRIKGDGDDAWIDDRSEAERALASRCFDQAFEETRRAEVTAAIPPRNLSAPLMTSLKIAGNHARNHPAILIPAVCKAVEAEHLPVFKRQGKLYTGPARPHPLPPGQALAERPGIMVEWIRANKPAKLEGLWKAVLPEGSSAPPAEFAADLFWLLHQGHILLFTDDTLVVQEIRETPAPDPNAEPKSGKKKKKKKNKKALAEGAAVDAAVPEAETGEPPEPADGENNDTSPEEAAIEPQDTPAAAEESSVSDDTPLAAEEDESPAPVEDAPAPVVDEIPVSTEDAPAPAAEIAETTPDASTPAPTLATEETPPALAEDLSKNPAAGVDESPAL